MVLFRETFFNFVIKEGDIRENGWSLLDLEKNIEGVSNNFVLQCILVRLVTTFIVYIRCPASLVQSRTNRK